jgi:hypothetical protein
MKLEIEQMNYIEAFVLVFLALSILISITIGFCHLLDSSFLPQLRDSGIVLRKYYVPESESKMFILGLNIYHTQINPESYNLVVKIDSNHGYISIVKSFYNSVSVGDCVYVIYCVGRFSSQISLKKIWK